jgi:hypothetical protein
MIKTIMMKWFGNVAQTAVKKISRKIQREETIQERDKGGINLSFNK